jgi:hypothetical protein
MRVPASFLALVLFAPPAAGEVDYLKEIKPLLQARCYPCHGALQQKARLRLDTAALMRKGGKHGPVVVPGKSGESLLIEAVIGTDRPRMPPENEGSALSDKEIALLRTWIDQGAKAPEEPTPPDPRQHWAFRVPVRPAIPQTSHSERVRNPIDAFLAAEWDRRGLQPRPPADKATLLRRVTLDLTGLPPTRAELHAFLADSSPDAYERVVDRLLASPRYGERWARHWMDVWRYSDWYGRRAVPDVWNSAPQIWRWRDWIVRSLNADKGYDRMVIEMLAADEVAPQDDETLVATGFLVRNWYALNYNAWMKDNVEHTGKAFLGLTFNCAHCHDHKYDPITQDDYFRLRAFFEPLELRQDRLPGEPDCGPFQKYEYTVLRKVVQTGTIRVFDEKLDAQTFAYSLGDERNRIAGKPPLAPGVPAFLGGDQLKVTPVQLPQAASYPGLKPFIRQDALSKAETAVTAARAALHKAAQGVAAATAPAADGKTLPEALVALHLSEARLETAEAERESVKARIAADDVRYNQAPGDGAALARTAAKAERSASLCAAKEKLLQAEQAFAAARRKADSTPEGKERDKATKAVQQAEGQKSAAAKALAAAQKALEAPGDKYTPLSPVYPTVSTGRRTALARWIASRDNPLTARVAVNHVWLRHFGRPLVESTYDFGRNGKRPTHPELLDWLAVELMESGWSFKHLHRLIVTSAAYRLRSGAGLEGETNRADADNVYLWQFPRRRLEAEAVRDSILFAAGELDGRLGGPVLEVKEEPNSRRRSLYFAVHPEDGGHLPMLELFDAPDACECYRRTESLVPQQALALTNGPLTLRASRLLARTLSEQTSEDAAFVIASFEQVLGRGPTAEEQAACLEFLRKQAELLRTAVPNQPAAGSATLAPATDPSLRAREGLMRALFNHNDFVSIR